MSPEEAQADWEWMPVKPDASNVLKGLEDRLVCFGLLKDDAMVVDARIRKIRSHTVGVTIRISEAAR
jgi:Holliday junction resolvase RusA-like endonuclease